MAKLPEILVKEFVRMTNDTSKKKSDSFLYGTVDKVNEDGTVDVVFDGADSSTPCASSVSVAEGDRVLAMLKNRQAVVTSNVSNPTVNATYLEAGEAKISGTIHAATYEDSTGNYTMEIGSVRHDDVSPVSPAFSIEGYFNGDPNEKYVSLSIHFQPPADGATGYQAFPTMWIEGSVRDNPDDIYDSHVNVGIGAFGIQFNGENNTIEDGKHVMYKAWTDLGWQNAQRYEEP